MNRVPKLRFKEFTNELKEIKFKDFLNERKDIATEKEELYSLTIEKGVTPKEERYERDFLVNNEKDAYKIVLKNDFVYNPMNIRFGAVAQFIENKNVKVSKYYNIFYCNNHINSYFFEKFIKTKRMFDLYNKLATGSLNEKKRLHFTDFLEIKQPFPCLEEQEKIGNFLSSVDKKISITEEKLDLFKEYKKGIMQKIFKQELRFKDNNGNDYPEWEEKKLGDIGTFFSGGTPKSDNKKYYNGDIPFIKSGEISKDKTEQFITKLGLDNSSAKMVKKGDLLFALYGATSGECAISKINGAINQAVLVIRTEENTVFLFNYFKFYKDNIIKKFLQGGQGNLSAEIIKMLIIKFPCIEEQQKIADFLFAIDMKIEKLSDELENLKEFKKGLLQQMFV